MKKNKSKAFTLAETLITLSIIAVLATLTIKVHSNGKATTIKRNKATTVSFYSNIDNVYQQVLFNHGSSGSIKDLIKTDATTNSQTLRTHFLNYLDASVDTCDILNKINTTTKSKEFINKNANFNRVDSFEKQVEEDKE